MAAAAVEVFTVGGGEYLVNVFNAIAGWTSAGGYRGLLKVVMVMAFAMALLGTAWNMDARHLLKWFMQATLMYMALIVPTVSVRVTDRTNPGLAPAVVDNVPIGLAGVASFTSQTGDYLTRSAETVFAMPAALGYSSGGMIYGAKLLDAAQSLRIDDPVLAANLNEHFRQCVFYDVLMGRKTIGEITQAADMFAALGPGSVSLSQQFTYADGSSNIQSCQSAYLLLAADWQDYYTAALPRIARQFFPGVSAANAQAKFESDLAGVSVAGLGGGVTSAQQLTRQAMMINAMMQARDGFSGGTAQSTVDAFAVTRADIQTRNTYSTIAAGAMKWVPLLNIVLTVVFYAMFPVIFLLSLMPTTGIGVIRGYITGFFYLAAWGPLFVVLNMVFMTRWQSALASWNPGGLNAANFAGISAINQDAGALAGFMIMSVPFIAAGMARGAMAIASHSTSYLAPSQSAAEHAAAEQTTGSYSYGNRQFNNLTANQWNDAPTYTSGFGQLVSRNADGTLSRQNADGTMSYDAGPGISNLGFMLQSTKDIGNSLQRGLTEGRGVVDQKRQSASDAWSTTYGESTRLFDTAQRATTNSTEEGRALSNSLDRINSQSQDWSQTLQRDFGFSRSFADELSRQASRTGTFSVDAALNAAAPGSTGMGGRLGMALTSQTQEGRTSRSGQTAEERLNSGLSYLERETASASAREARESFVRQTSGSSDSTLRGLSRDFQQDLRRAQTVSTDASRAEDAYQRWQTDLAQFEKNGFTLNRNDSQEFVQFAAEQMLDPANRHLDQSYHPGIVNLTPTQAMTQDVLLDRFMADKVAQMRGELGLIPEAPAGNIADPGLMSVAGIRSEASGGMSGLAALAPSVATGNSSRDRALESQVRGRIANGDDRLRDQSALLKNAVLGAGGVGAERLRQAVIKRQSGSLMDSMPSLLGGDNAVEKPRGSLTRSDTANAPVTAGPVEARLPPRGEGFTTYGRQSGGANQVGTQGMIDELSSLGTEWARTGNPPISLGHLSQAGGGTMPGHAGHRHGIEVDVRPFRLDGRNAPTTWSSAQYDRAATREFVEMVRARHPGASILFNDPQLVREGLVQLHEGHDNHLHLQLAARTPR